MRDCWKNRAGYDRVLMAVAATFLTVSATSALAQSDQVRNSAAELAIDAAIPRPEPANVPPPTAQRFQAGHCAGTRRGQGDRDGHSGDEAGGKASRSRRRSDLRARQNETAAKTGTDSPRPTFPKPTAPRPIRADKDTATVAPAQPPAAATATAPEPAKEPIKAASNVAPADQPVADRLRDMLGAKSLRYFDRKAERAAVEKFYTAREYAPIWTQAGKLTDSGKGVIARLKDAASDGLNASDYPVPDFAPRPRPMRWPRPT